MHAPPNFNFPLYRKLQEADSSVGKCAVRAIHRSYPTLQFYRICGL
jgi:hypothetical protein